MRPSLDGLILSQMEAQTHGERHAQTDARVDRQTRKIPFPRAPVGAKNKLLSKDKAQHIKEKRKMVIYF